MADGAQLYVDDEAGGSQLFGFDTTLKKATGPYSVGGTDTQVLAMDGHSLWMDFYDSGVVARLDPPAPTP